MPSVLRENLHYFRKHILRDPHESRDLYLVYNFVTIVKNLEKFIDFTLVLFSAKAHRYDMVTSFFFFLAKRILGHLKKYRVVHLNTFEVFLLAKKYKNQVLIGESHGFHFGINFSDTVKHFHGLKHWIAKVIESIFGPLIRCSIKKFDIYYVSTPNMLAHALRIRPDARWLPNAINTGIFTNEGPKAHLVGDPVIFCPTRLHSFKNPEFAINLFYKIKAKYPGATLHLIKYPHGGDPLAEKYSQILTDPDTYFWHEFQTAEGLASMYRASDIVLGHFHPTLGMMSLVELEATSCGTAVISYDKYEIHTHLEDLEKITFDILEDKDKYREFITSNRRRVLEKHDPERVAKKLAGDIARIEVGITLVRLSEKLIESHMEDITRIEDLVFPDVGTWGKKEFLYPNKNKFDCSFVLLLKNKIIGFVVGYTHNHYAYINRIAVYPDWSGHGLGNFLLESFENTARHFHGAEVLELVTHDHLSVDTFYKKNGFSRIEDEEDLVDFLTRKGKIDHKNEYIGPSKTMILFSKKL